MCVGEPPESTKPVKIPGVDDNAIESKLIARELMLKTERKPRPLFETTWKSFNILCNELMWIALLVVPFRETGMGGLLVQLVGFVVGTFAVDLIGILTHFFFDNYGSKDTWLIGGIIDTFDRHHVTPYSAFGYDHVDLVYIEKTYAMMIIAFFWSIGAVHIGSAFSMALWSAVLFWGGNIPLIHKAAHTARPDEPWATLQRWGILIDKQYHSQHHRNLSIKHSLVCGHMDSVCEATRFIPALEVIVYLSLGAVAHHSQLGLTSEAIGRSFWGRVAAVRACMFA